MSKILLKLLILIALVSCKNNEGEIENTNELANKSNKQQILSQEKEGYIFVNINKLYQEGGKFAISDDNGDYLILFNKERVLSFADASSIFVKSFTSYNTNRL